MKPRLRIIGGGMGQDFLLTKQAKTAVADSKRLLSTFRLGESLGKELEIRTLSEIMAELEKNQQDIAVVVSGDVGFFSLAKSLIEKFSEKYEIESIPGINSMQYLMAKICQPYDNLFCLSLHGRNSQLIPAVSYNRRVFVLTGGENTVQQILENLLEAGLEQLEITVGQRLSYDDERIIVDSPKKLLEQSFDPLAVMLITNNHAANPNRRIKDEDFIRGKTPMTKEHIRVLSVDRLEISPSDIVYDIGAGTGSVSVALAYKANQGMVYAVEKSPLGIALIERNREELGAYNIKIIKTDAPKGLENLPIPNKVFIGGSGGNLSQIIKEIFKKTKDAIFCVNLVTLENLAEVISCFKELEFQETEISCINCAKGEKLGEYHLMKGENPIYIISGRYKCQQE